MANSSFFDFHCPTGGNWYACDKGSRFVGCCTTDPCANGCVQGNIRPGAYNISHHGEWPDASCGSASDFFTCNAGPSFWGCCKSNPCAATPPSTCPQGDLVPAFMERPEQFNAYTSAGAKSNSSSSSNTGAIVGGTVGGVVVLGVIGAIFFFVLRRRRNRRPGGDGAAAMVPMMKGEKHDDNSDSAQYDGRSPPPTYASPMPDHYQHNSAIKGQQPYHQYTSHAVEPQELPAEVSSSQAHRYSELPANISSGVDNRRFSELPAQARGPAGLSELESPEPTPRPLQAEFSSDKAKQASGAQGLGIN